MLTPTHVIPFLSHDDPKVRATARTYLSSAHDPAPTTADDFWAAADKVPPGETGWYIDRVGLVPQTDASLRRLLDELPKADPATSDSLRRTLERVEFNLLRQHWDTIRAADGVDEKTREHFQSRLSLIDEPPEPLWERMMTLARRLDERDELTESEELEADRLIEAVSRHPDVFRERIAAAISDPSVKGWAELLVTDIAGQMRLTEAIGPLLDKLKVEDGDLLWDVAADALVHIGNEQVVQQAAERFGRDGPGFQISAAEVLGRIKRPEAQAALLQLLPAESDLGTVSSIVSALVQLLPDDAETFATLRAIARSGGYDRTALHLDEELLALATMTGLELPEASEWRQRIEENRSRWATGMRDVDHLFQSPGSLGPSTMHAAPLAPPSRGSRSAAAVAQRPPVARRPFRNASTKVGRNDPCACGSGKKHKKCCGK